MRDYQREAAAALWNGWLTGGRRLAVVLPTGSGKTVIMAHLAVERANAGERVLILVHRDELIDQTAAKLRKLEPSINIGVVKAERNDTLARVVIASIQTLARARRLDQLISRGRFGLVLADEIHLSVSDSWVRVLKAVGCWQADGPRLGGFTATFSRADRRGLADVWEDVVYTKGIKWFIERGYLVPPVAHAVTTGVDFDNLKVKGGDYDAGDMDVKLATDTARDAIIEAYQTFASGRIGVLFAPTVDSARYFAEGLTSAGIRTEGVFGETSRPQRAEIYARQRKGETQCLATCTALAEGWDAPWTSVGILVRPTLHQGLFVQQIGRTLRPWPDKSDAVILDAAGATRRHSLHAVIELNETEEKTAWNDTGDEEEPEERGPSDAPEYRGPVGFEQVDLFAGTGARWLTTAGGVLFVGMSTGFIFLHEQDGAWSVGFMEKYQQRGQWLAEGLDAEEAITEGADYAIREDPTVASSTASWRKGRRAPSDAQIGYAAKLGISADGESKDSLSDKITIKLASRQLARFARANSLEGIGA